MATNVIGWYASREAIKQALKIPGTSRDRLIDRTAASASREIERVLGERHFFPVTKKREYRWPQPDGVASRLFLDQDLIAVTALTKDGDDETAIASGDFFLEPVNTGPPYDHIEIDQASGNFFASASDSAQRAIRVTGRWGYNEDSEAAGTIDDASGISASDTTLEISDASLVDVGNVLLIGTESIFVSAKGTKDTTANLDTADLTRDDSEVSINCSDLAVVNVGEVLLIEAERMLIVDKSAASGAGLLTVERAYDGSLLAAHTQPVDMLAFRSLTIVRGVNGTTAAIHADTTAIVRYLAPADIENAVLAVAEFYYQHGGAGWTGELAAGDAVAESRGVLIEKLIMKTAGHLGRRYVGAL